MSDRIKINIIYKIDKGIVFEPENPEDIDKLNAFKEELWKHLKKSYILWIGDNFVLKKELNEILDDDYAQVIGALDTRFKNLDEFLGDDEFISRMSCDITTPFISKIYDIKTSYIRQFKHLNYISEKKILIYIIHIKKYINYINTLDQTNLEHFSEHCLKKTFDHHKQIAYGCFTILREPYKYDIYNIKQLYEYFTERMYKSFNTDMYDALDEQKFIVNNTEYYYIIHK